MSAEKIDPQSHEENVAERLTYREDDYNYLKRLNTMVQFAWIYNTVITLIICVGIFYLLGYDILFGIILGILLALFTNFHYTLYQVDRASRWEVFKNRVILPKGIMGGANVIMFEEIESIEIRKGLFSKVLEIKLIPEGQIRLSIEDDGPPISTLIEEFNQYSEVKSRRKAVIPTSDSNEFYEPTEH